VNAEANIDTFLLKRLAEQSGQCLDLASVLLATDEMLNAAQGGHWERVSELESSRRKRLDRCFAQTILPENSELFSEALAVMLHLNEELMQLLQNAREAAAVQNSDQMRTQKSIKHYLDIDSER
jgi:beta-phosphoglucomutase-like phosphatase (HAD superfamily)